MAFSEPYKFSVTVVWSKPDGNFEEKTLSETVVWFDLTIPQFKITYAPKPVLVTAAENTEFKIDPVNFELDTIQDYEVVWELSPQLS